MSDPPVKIPQPAARLSVCWLAAGGYVAVALALLWPLPLRLTTHMTGDPFGDPLLNAWVLGWDAERLRHGLQGLWQAPLFYPAPDTLAWSEHLLGIAVFVAPAYWLTGNLVLVYNIALLGSIVLAGVGMYLLIRELTGRSDAAWLGGLLFACLPYRVAELTHLQVMMAGWMPLALLGLHRYFKTGSRSALVGFVAAYVLTALSNGYYLFFLAVPVLIVATWHLADRAWRGERILRTTGMLTAAAMTIALALSPVVAAYLRVRQAQGFTRTRGEMVNYSATPAAYGTVSSSLRVWKDVLPIGRNERELFPGLFLIILAGVGLVAGRPTPVVRIYALVAVSAFLLTLGPEPDVGFGRWPTGPYDWLLALPGVGGLRVPARFAIVVYLGLSVLAGAGAARLLSRMAPRLALAAVVCLTLATLVEGLPVVRLSSTASELSHASDAYQWLRRQPRGPMLELPVGQTHESVRYLAATLVHGNRIVNGYSGHGSALEDVFGGPPSGEPQNAGELLRAARMVGVRYLLVHAHLFGDPSFAAGLVRAIQQNSDHVEGIHEFATTAVVVLRPMAVAGPAALDPTLTLSGCQVRVSHNAAVASRAVDGDLATRWLTGVPQHGDEWLEVRCPATQVLTSFELQTNRRSYGDYPRRLAVDASADSVSFVPLWEGGVVAELAASVARTDRPTAIRIAVPPTPFVALRFRQTGQTPRNWFWSIDELQLRGR